MGVFGKELSEDEVKFWLDFLKPSSLGELRYAFETYTRNHHYPPKPKDISDLCDAYRISLENQEFPIGCHRCEWNGYYEVRRKGVERFMAQCPCVKNPSLRERGPRHGEGYNATDVMWIYHRYMGMKDSLPDRPMTDGEINTLLDELDRHRGRKPAWR